MANTTDIKNWLAENPKMMGALWMMTILLSEMGTVVASGDAKFGP